MNEKKENIPETPAAPAPEKPDKGKSRSSRPGRGWRRFLLIYAAVWLLFAGLGCAAFYKYLRVYEEALPEHVMDDLMESTDRAAWLSYVQTSIEGNIDAFDNAQTVYSEYVSTLLDGHDFSYRRAPEFSDEAPVFIVRCGSADVCTVTLTAKPDSDLGFDKHLWQVADITPCDALSNLQSTALDITVMTGTNVYVNGTLLTDEQTAETGITFDDMPEIETRFTSVPTRTRYYIEKMYGTVTVTLEDGTELSPVSTSDGTTYYETEQQRYSVSISAPEDVTVTLCGAVLTKDDAQSCDRGVLQGVEDFTGDSAYDTVRWSFEDLYSVPDVRAVDKDGTELTPLAGKDGQIFFFHANNDALQRAQENTVQHFLQCYINYTHKSFQGNLDVTREQAYDDSIEMDETIRDSMVRYYRLLDCILPWSELYDNVKESTDAMIWASATNVEYNEREFGNFSFVGTNCFVCTASYDAELTAHSWSESNEYNLSNVYELVYVCSNGCWYVASMNALSE